MKLAKMSRSALPALGLALLCQAALAVRLQLPVVVKTTFVSSITTDVVFFNEQSIRSRNMTFAACNRYHGNKVLDCAVHLVWPVSELASLHAKCPTRYYPPEGRVVHRILLLRPLRGGRVLFQWLVVGASDVPSEPYSIVRVINMEDCESRDARLPLGEAPFFHGAAVVVYSDSFDALYRDESTCGDTMCAETHDADGRLVSGPAASRLPAEPFKRSTFVCPVQPASAAMGHFLVARKLQLVDPMSGQAIKELMDFPPDVYNVAFGCDHGLLGFCWIEAENDTHVNCRQYDSQGERVVSTRVDLNYRLGSTMSLKNQRGGGLLLQSNECAQAEEWCDANLPELSFFVHRIDPSGDAMLLHEVNRVYCGSSLEVVVDEKPNRDVCLTFGCVGESLVPQTNIDVRTFVYCMGLRNVSALADADSLPTAEEPVTKKPTKPSKKQRPRWHV